MKKLQKLAMAIVLGMGVTTHAHAEMELRYDTLNVYYKSLFGGQLVLFQSIRQTIQ
jgi:hypothetical protein